MEFVIGILEKGSGVFGGTGVLGCREGVLGAEIAEDFGADFLGVDSAVPDGGVVGVLGIVSDGEAVAVD